MTDLYFALKTSRTGCQGTGHVDVFIYTVSQWTIFLLSLFNISLSLKCKNCPPNYPAISIFDPRSLL